MSNRIGTCSLCGGPVVMPEMMVNPVPHCQKCGATTQSPHGPVIPMQPRKTVPGADWHPTSPGYKKTL